MPPVRLAATILKRSNLKMLVSVCPALPSLRGETPEELKKIILSIMEPYNMHRVPSPEMEDLDLTCFYLAIINESQEVKCVGAAGYKMLDAETGKTTLLAVLPEYSKHGIGKKLQEARVSKMRSLGARKVITNADREESIAWYKKQGYFEIGTLPKLHSFGLDSVDHWTTLQLNLA